MITFRLSKLLVYKENLVIAKEKYFDMMKKKKMELSKISKILNVKIWVQYKEKRIFHECSCIK